MKKNLLALAALGASVALLAGCGTTTTPEVEENTGAVVEETTTTPELTTGTVTTETTTDTSDAVTTGTAE